FYIWFKENSPLCGKGKTMQKISEAFPDSAFTIKQPFSPFRFQKYSIKAAKPMNKWKQEGRLIVEKKGRVFCFE
ncbi:MAG: hypothetical protein KAT16_08585, partial [Candidatus Heimdallarchaeota archaeon]|nr:hypothetical protein [Candidatus Heimdallarchaeota archaeon]